MEPADVEDVYRDIAPQFEESMPVKPKRGLLPWRLWSWRTVLLLACWLLSSCALVGLGFGGLAAFDQSFFFRDVLVIMNVTTNSTSTVAVSRCSDESTYAWCSGLSVFTFALGFATWLYLFVVLVRVPLQKPLRVLALCAAIGCATTVVASATITLVLSTGCNDVWLSGYCALLLSLGGVYVPGLAFGINFLEYLMELGRRGRPRLRARRRVADIYLVRDEDSLLDQIESTKGGHDVVMADEAVVHEQHQQEEVEGDGDDGPRK